MFFYSCFVFELSLQQPLHLKVLGKTQNFNFLEVIFGNFLKNSFHQCVFRKFFLAWRRLKTPTNKTSNQNESSLLWERGHLSEKVGGDFR